MKAGTANHIKMRRLKRRFGIPLWQAIGMLETLWQLAADCADDGDLSKYTPEDIASYFEWEGDDQELVDGLADCGWVDRAEETGAVAVHDWLDHAPNYIKDRVRKRKQRTYDDSSRTSTGQVRDKSVTVPRQSQLTQPNPTNPNPTKVTKKRAPDARAFFGFDVPEELDSEDFRSAWSDWVSHRSDIRKPLTKTSVKQQLSKFAEWGITRSVAAIQHTIAQSWQGIREPEPVNGQAVLDPMDRPGWKGFPGS